MLYGEEIFLLEKKLIELQKKYNIDSNLMNLSIYDDSLISLEQVVEDCNTPPFLTEYKMVILKNCNLFTTKKTPEKNKQHIEILEKYIENPAPHTILVIYQNEKNFDERKAIVKKLRKQTKFITIDEVSFQELKDMTKKAFMNRGCTIDEDAFELLLSRVDGRLLNVSSEVEKLSLYTKHIHYEDVDKLVSKPLEEDGFELVSAIMKKDQCKCMEIYKDLMIQNYEPIMLIIMISNQIRLAYEIKILERKGYQHFEMAKMLGINPYRIKYIKQDMGLFDKQDLLDKLEELALLDRNIKQGRIDKKNGLELFLMKG